MHHLTRTHPLLVRKLVACEHKGCLFFLHKCQLRFQLFRPPQVVRIQVGDIAADGFPQSLVPGPGRPYVLLTDQQPQALIPPGLLILPDHLGGSIPAAVHHQQQFPVPVSLGRHMLHGLHYIFLRIVHRHNDADRFIHCLHLPHRSTPYIPPYSPAVRAGVRRSPAAAHRPG